MAYCPHCAFSMPSPGPRANCPNCGRKKVKLQDRKPSFFSNTTAYEYRETSRGTFLSSFLAAGAVILCAIAFLVIGVMVKGPMGMLWDLLGVVSAIVGAYCLHDLYRNFTNDRNPQKAYIDHLRDLEDSKKSLVKKIKELEELVDRQKSQGSSTRAANRLRLVSAAMKNRKLKLNLIEETEFIIESKRKISRLEALAQDVARGKRLRETDREIDSAFADLGGWLKRAPKQCRSVAGTRVKEALQQALELNEEIQEQIEDRIVMRALEDGNESDESFALEKVHDFLEKMSIQDHLNTLEMEETAAADEEYLKINAELRLIKDGISSDFPNDTFIDLEPLDEKMN